MTLANKPQGLTKVDANRSPAKMRALRAVAVTTAAVALCGCNTLAKNNYFLPGGVDQHSAVASQVSAAQSEQGAFPTFAEIPPLPGDVRPLSAWRATVHETLAAKRETLAELERRPWTLSGTEAFAEDARAKIPPAEAAPPTDTTAEAESFAAGARGRAKTPPPAH